MRALVLDANILIRAVLGQKVRCILMSDANTVRWFVPSYCVEEARKHLPTILTKRGVDVAPAIAVLDALLPLLTLIEQQDLTPLQNAAMNRLQHRDINDWPVLAAALLLNCPIWTEDHDFFGTGVATWTTSTIQYFLQD